MTQPAVTGPSDLNASIRRAATEDSLFSLNFVVLSLASCAIATLGLLENSVAVIIGAMIIAPLMGPIQAFAFAALDGDAELVRRSLVTAVAGAAIAIGASALLGTLFALPSYGSEVVARTRPNILDLLVAVSAGAVAGFAKIRPAIANTIAGTAIAVALMPPLCVVGLTLAHHDWSSALGAALLFGTNFLGIALACMLVYVAARQFRSNNRSALITTAVITAALVFPLGASFLEIVRDARIESEIRSQLTTNTVTFRQVRLVSTRFDWYARPVIAQLTVSAADPVSPSQVRDLEAFIERKTGQRLRLVLHVNQFATVTDQTTAVGSTDAGLATPPALSGQ